MLWPRRRFGFDLAFVRRFVRQYRLVKSIKSALVPPLIFY
jgi:hypothetical protein